MLPPRVVADTAVDKIKMPIAFEHMASPSCKQFAEQSNLRQFVDVNNRDSVRIVQNDRKRSKQSSPKQKGTRFVKDSH